MRMPCVDRSQMDQRRKSADIFSCVTIQKKPRLSGANSSSFANRRNLVFGGSRGALGHTDVLYQVLDVFRRRRGQLGNGDRHREVD